MDQQYRHAMLPETNHDEQARQIFVRDLRLHLASSIAPGTRQVYQAKVKPAFEKSEGRPPKDRHEVRKLMTENPFYQLWSAMQRSSQEMIWDSVADTIERTLPAMQAKARAFDENNPKGSVRLNPDLEIPRYHTAADIHLQPGGYHTEFTENDLSLGAMYDRGVYLYIMGMIGPKNDDLAVSLAKYVKQAYPDFKPKRILDIGCATGASTLPWAEAYPEAEVHGIDVGAPQLRYGHARAEAMGLPVHFSQQNAEATDFPDGHFDLIVSCIMLHETSTTALPNILKECKRLLAPGGMMAHLEIPMDQGQDPYDSFMFEWEVYNNNETFLGKMRDLDFVAEAEKAGFEAGKARMEGAPSNMMSHSYSDGGFAWPVLVAEK